MSRHSTVRKWELLKSMQQQHNNFGHAHISTASQYDDFIMMKEILQVKLILRVFNVKYKPRYIIQFETTRLQNYDKIYKLYDTDM